MGAASKNGHRSERQLQIRRVLREWRAEHRGRPTTRQIGDAVGLFSAGSVAYQLHRWRSGPISRSGHLWRTGWGSSLLISLITIPVVEAAWNSRDWYKDCASWAGRNRA
ncbi:hypothetical protein [Streptomyces sp. NBC_00344]|uniref:LexA family protein n=1 Tax=Streptomyces sp. NBC_00344 TaxID=2975720 RepID=UPI002E214FA6